MDTNRAKNAAKNVGNVVLVAAGIGIGGYTLLILADILTFWWFFSRMSTVLAARGVDSDLARIFGTAFAVLSAVAIHGVLWLLLTRKTRLWALSGSGRSCSYGTAQCMPCRIRTVADHSMCGADKRKPHTTVTTLLVG